MQPVISFFEGIDGWLKQVISLSGSLQILYNWIAKPIKNMQSDIRSVKQDISVLKDDTADILCDRLNQAYDYHTSKKWCPKADKQRLVGMHKRYNALGRNHLTEHYEEDIIKLPERPPV